MDIDELTAKMAVVEKTATIALEQAQRATELATHNALQIKEVDLRARSAEHRISKLEGKIDTILNKLSGIGKSQDDSAKQSERIRKNTIRVLATLIAAIIVNVLNNL